MSSLDNIGNDTDTPFISVIYSDHSAPEQWPIEKKTSTPKIHPNESVLLLYIDI